MDLRRPASGILVSSLSSLLEWSIAVSVSLIDLVVVFPANSSQYLQMSLYSAKWSATSSVSTKTGTTYKNIQTKMIFFTSYRLLHAGIYILPSGGQVGFEMPLLFSVDSKKIDFETSHLE